jgi:hypothetical protein
MHVGDIHGCGNVQHVTGGIDDFASHGDGIGCGSLRGIRETLKFSKHTAPGVEDSVHQASLRKRETAPRESSYFCVIRRPHVWTGLGIQRACIGNAAVVLKDIRSQGGIRKVLNICTDRGAELFRDLHGGIAYDDVAAEYVAAFSSCTNAYAIEVSADFVLLNQVVTACANQAEAKVITNKTGSWGGGTRN